MQIKEYRKYLVKTYGHLYKRFKVNGRCFYCGEDANTIDHCPSLDAVDSITTKQLKRIKIPFVLLSCCKNCNTTLGNKHLLTVASRLEFLYSRLSRKYEEKFSLWQEEEIAEMSPMFQNMIRAEKKKLEIMNCRLRYIEQRLFDTDSHPSMSDQET